MALDVYVGALARYYSGNWENRAQTWARESGVKYEAIRPQNATLLGRAARGVAAVFGRSRNRTRSIEGVRSAVVLWREQLNTSLPGIDLNWKEDMDAPYFTDRPAWDGYGGLILWTAYDEHPEMQRPAKLNPHEWSHDAAFVDSMKRGLESHYPHLMRAELWLPMAFDTPFSARDVRGQDCTFGSSFKLLVELRRLNDRTWQADAETTRKGMSVLPITDDLETAAQFGFGIFHSLAELSVQHRLPMKLDY